MTFVAWATGLGLVIGSIVMIATVTAPTHSTLPLKVLRQSNSTLGPGQYGVQPPSGAAGKSPRYHVLAAFSGHGNRRTGQFSVKARRRWQLRWTYRCDPRADAGQFTLQAGTGPEQAIITSAGGFAASGHGLVVLRATTQRHYLVVVSACTWHVKVMQAA